jgi:hypothetical protein
MAKAAGPKSPVAIDRAEFDGWVNGLESLDTRPLGAHALLHGHNGQTLAWVGGSQHRTIATWLEAGKNKVMPEIVPTHSGLACEVTPMLAHSSNNVTINIRSRYAWEIHENEAAKAQEVRVVETQERLRPDTRPVTGQSICATVRMPVGSAMVVGSGSGTDAKTTGFELVLLVSNEFVAPPE